MIVNVNDMISTATKPVEMALWSNVPANIKQGNVDMRFAIKA